MLRIVALLIIASSVARAEDQPLSAQEVRKVVESHLGAVKSCIGKEAPSGPKGKVVVHYTILPDGKVEKPSVHESSTGNAKLDHCIVEVFRTMQFPAPRGAATMEQLYPFQFTAPPPVGDLTPEQVAGAVKPHLEEIKACYQPALSDEKPQLKGKVIMFFVVKKDGVVGSAKIVKSDTGFAKGDTCLTEALKKWSFPKPANNAEATIPDFPFVINLEANKGKTSTQATQH